MKNLKHLVLILFVFPLFVHAQTLDEKLKEIDDYANTVISTWKDSGAGMAIAIVRDDKVVFQKGYGVKWIEPTKESLNFLPNTSPEEAYRQLFTAVKNQDTSAIMAAMTEKTWAFAKMASERNNTSTPKVFSNGFTATTFANSLPEIRDNRTKDGFASIEVYNAHDSRWEDLPFVFENKGWRLAVGELFAGTFISPGRSAAVIEMEKAAAAAPKTKPTPGIKEIKKQGKSSGLIVTKGSGTGSGSGNGSGATDNVLETPPKPDKSQMVDENTLFAIASNTKAFTTASLAILVDEKKIAWNDKVSKYLPDFQMYDPWVTNELTIRDIVSHRSGLDTFSGDLLWYDTTYSTDEMLRRVRYLKPVSSFRSRYGYQNLMFIAAGRIVEKVSGKPWAEFVRERILTPLGMNRTTTSVTDMKDNFAYPHNESGGKLRSLPVGFLDNAIGAVRLNSSVADLSKWIRLQLGRGTFEGKKIFSEEQSWTMWSPNTLQPISEAASKNNPTRHYNAYAMGWGTYDYYGRKIINHSGGLDGMLSYTVLIPEENVGFVVLTNSESPAFAVMMSKIRDVFVNAPKRDWNAEAVTQITANKAADAKGIADADAARVLNTKPSLAMTAYAGTYTSQMYGDVTVAEENGKLVLRLGPAPNFVADLEHWHYDTFQIHWRPTVHYNFPRGFVTFTIDKNGKTDQLKIDQPNNDFWFYELDLHRSK